MTVETGDGRFCIIARTLLTIGDWWEAESAFSVDVADELNVVLRQDLQAVLAAVAPADAARRGHELYESVTALINQREA